MSSPNENKIKNSPYLCGISCKNTGFIVQLLTSNLISEQIFEPIGRIAKCGIQKTDSDVATALRTVVVLVFSWILVFFTGTMSGVNNISG